MGMASTPTYNGKIIKGIHYDELNYCFCSEEEREYNPPPYNDICIACGKPITKKKEGEDGKQNSQKA